MLYYLARLLSSQYQRDFSHAEYDKLRKVYSIWIVMDPSIRNPNIISSIAFRQAALMGDPEDNRVYDKAETFIVRLQKQGALRSEDRLIGILSTLFGSDLSPAEKKTVLVDDYSIAAVWTQECIRAAALYCYVWRAQRPGRQASVLWPR